MRNRLWMAGLALALLGLPAGPRGTAAVAPTARTLIDDFEGDVADRWQGLIAETATIHEGKSAGKWAGELKQVTVTRIAHDWSIFRQPRLDFWCHSQAATGARFRLTLRSSKGGTPGPDGYSTLIEVDWTGWRQVQIPLSDLRAVGQPAGLDKVWRLDLSFDGEGTLRRPGTELCFDDMWLCELAGIVAPPPPVEPPVLPPPPLPPPPPANPLEGIQTPEFDVAHWAGMLVNLVHRREGLDSGYMRLDARQPAWGRDIPNDWSRYTELEFWLYAHNALGFPLRVVATSDGRETPELGYYYSDVVVDWEGWRYVRMPLEAFCAYKNPGGWRRIQRVAIASLADLWRYRPETIKEDGYLCFDAMRLRSHGGGLTLGEPDAPANTPAAWQVARQDAGMLWLRASFTQENVGLAPVPFQVDVEDPLKLVRGPGERARIQALGVGEKMQGNLSVAIPRDRPLRLRDFCRTVEVVSTPAQGPLAPAVAPLSLEPLYYRCLELLKLPLPDELPIEDFEEGTFHWSALQPATDVTHEGAHSALWEDVTRRHTAFCDAIPHDWSRYSALSFWMHAERATGQQFHVLAFSDNPRTQGLDYYYAWKIPVDWTGWKRFTLRFDDMETIREPVGWNKIDRLAFTTHWFVAEEGPGTVLHLDDIRLLGKR